MARDRAATARGGSASSRSGTRSTACTYQASRRSARCASRVAIVIEKSFSLVGDEALLTAAFLIVASPVATHAIGRAIRIAERDDWRLGDDEHVEIEERAVNVFLAFVLTLVGVVGLLVVLTHDPVRQTVLTGVLSLLLAVLFFAVQAPDVALSELVDRHRRCAR